LKRIYGHEKKSALTILKYYEGEPLNVDTFFRAITGVMFAQHFIPNTNTFEEVISSSNMKLISDQTIKNEILDLRSLYSTIKAQEDHIQHDLTEYLYTNVSTTVDYAPMLKPDRANNDRVKKDIKKLMEIIQFKNFCVIMAANTGNLAVNSYEPAILKCDSLLKRIDAKLNVYGRL
jgi:hypothetical protein